MGRLRRFYWRRIRRYAYEVCDRCGRPASGGVGAVALERGELVPQTYWSAPSDFWNSVIGGPAAGDDPGGVLCCRCFTAECNAQGRPVAWVAAPQYVAERIVADLS